MSIFNVRKVFFPKDLEVKVKKALKRSRDLRPWLKQSGLQLLSSVQLNFRQGGRPAWPGLKLSTLLRRGSSPGGGGRAKALLDTGLLANSIISGAQNKGPVKNPKLRSGKNMLKLTKRALQVGTNLSYAAIHQFGGYGPGGSKIPARPFLLAQDSDVKVMIAFAGEFVQGDL